MNDLIITEWPIESVIPYDRSLKVRSHVKIRAIAHSIQNYGFDQPIVVDNEGVVIKGIGRLEAAKFLKLEHVPVIQVNNLNAMEIIANRIADNKVAESEWDKDFLWLEVEDLINEGMEPNAFGFDAKRLQDMFPEMLLDDFNPDHLDDPNRNPGGNRPPLPDENLTDDQMEFGTKGIILSHKKDDLWLNYLPMIDYLNTHDTIIVNLSAGKTSIATLFWCIEHGLKDKLYVLYGNVGWGVETPDTYRYLKYIEDKADIKIHYAGSSNPRHPGGFEDNIMQFGFPEMFNDCWIETEIRNARINAILKTKRFKDKNKNSPLPDNPFIGDIPVVQVMGVRWEGNPVNRTKFPNRGSILGNDMHFASPLITWKSLDVVRYLKEKGCKLHSIYKTQDKHNCFLCPKNKMLTMVRFRKLYPKLWTQVLTYYSEGGRFTSLLSDSIYKWITSSEDLDSVVGTYSSQIVKDSNVTQFMKNKSLDKKYRNSAHRIVDDDLQGQPIYKSVTDQYGINVCN